jgi:hypothetical protein
MKKNLKPGDRNNTILTDFEGWDKTGCKIKHEQITLLSVYKRLLTGYFGNKPLSGGYINFV